MGTKPFAQQLADTDLVGALRRLDSLQISCRGPFLTPNGQRIYVIADCILREEEILELHALGTLNLDQIRKVRSGGTIATGV